MGGKGLAEWMVIESSRMGLVGGGGRCSVANGTLRWLLSVPAFLEFSAAAAAANKQAAQSQRPQPGEKIESLSKQPHI